MKISEIQKWEMEYSHKKGVQQDEKTARFIAISKLTEEVGEVAKALLEGNWHEVQAEVADVIIFACKVSTIAERFHHADSLTNVLKRKIGYCENRQYNPKAKKMDKPKSAEFH